MREGGSEGGGRRGRDGGGAVVSLAGVGRERRGGQSIPMMCWGIFFAAVGVVDVVVVLMSSTK